MPIASDKTNATPTVDDHAAHHNALATAVNDHEAQLDALESDNAAQDAAIEALGGGLGAVPVFIQATEPVVTGAALWIQPGGGFSIQEA